MTRLGLCCLFKEQEIHFRQMQAVHYGKKEKPLEVISELILGNLAALESALIYCKSVGIGAFRISSQLFPLYTHPEVGYVLSDLPSASSIEMLLAKCKEAAQTLDIRLTFHPDQFVVLNSPRTDVVEKSIEELLYHTNMAIALNADVINIHAGGVYGDKKEALSRLKATLKTLPDSLLQRLTLENDDKSYTPEDLFPLCKEMHIPLVYDVHHHRCNKDSWSIQQATEKALETWDREPLFHLSSPLLGWDGPGPSRHHDYIDINDFPQEWLSIDPLTIEVEAKAKELAIAKLLIDLKGLRV